MNTTIIQGISVEADPTLSQEQISQLISELKHTWTWEGRQIGRVEIIRDGQTLNLLTYEKPVLKSVSLNYNEARGANK